MDLGHHMIASVFAYLWSRLWSNPEGFSLIFAQTPTDCNQACLRQAILIAVQQPTFSNVNRLEVFYSDIVVFQTALNPYINTWEWCQMCKLMIPQPDTILL